MFTTAVSSLPVIAVEIAEIVDSHSKWLEVFPVATTTATATINVLRAVFARYGLPREVVSDNVPQFVSEEY